MSGSGDSKRLWVTLSFAMMFMLGVPIWWKSTEIYRAELPYEEIETWYKSQPHNEPFDVLLAVFLPSSWINHNTKNLQILSNALDIETKKHNDGSCKIRYTPQIHTAPDSFHVSEFTCESMSEWINQQSTKPQNGHYAFIVIPESISNAPRFTICPSRIVLIRTKNNSVVSDEEISSCMLGIANIASHKLVSSPNTEEKSRKKIQSNTAFRITFSLLQDSEGWEQPITSWEFPQYANGLLSSFLSQLRATADIHVDSQIKYFVKLQRTPEFQESSYFFNSSVLPHILAHPNEWNSDFIATIEPSLHFIVYVPPKRYSPLLLRDSSDSEESYNAYIIPQTGGVVIFNRQDNGTSNALSKAMIHDMIEIFVAQLRELFGLTPLSDLSQLTEKSIEVIPSKTGIAEWERDLLLRERTYENLLLSTTNLHSLSEMVQKLTNMMISDQIQMTVVEAIDALQQAREAIKQQQYELAQTQSRIAMKKAHEAFFDPDMLSLLYFPDEHKFAIYTPLFLPISIPMVLKLISEIKNAKRKRAAKLKKKNE